MSMPMFKAIGDILLMPYQCCITVATISMPKSYNHRYLIDILSMSLSMLYQYLLKLTAQADHLCDFAAITRRNMSWRTLDHSFAWVLFVSLLLSDFLVTFLAMIVIYLNQIAMN